MPDIEQNKKAITDVFALEDAKAVCEAIGGLGIDPNDETTDEPLEYTPDNILDVVVNDNPDGMPAFPQLGQTEMDDETKSFVADEMAKRLQADGREALSPDDLTPYAVVIKGENNISQDVNAFIDGLIDGSGSRLSTQNVSEAQPSGVATDLSNQAEPSVDAAPAADAVAEPAPGALPAEEPALDTNPDAAPVDDFNLDVTEPAPEVPAEGDADSFNLDVDSEPEAPAEDDTDTIGELDFGDEAPAEEAPAEGGEEDDLFSALDGMSDESLDTEDAPAEDAKADEEGPAEEEKAGEEEPKEDEEKPAETECAAAPVNECGEAPVTECGDKPMNEDAEVPEEPMDDASAESLEDIPLEESAVTECGDKPMNEDAEVPEEPMDDASAESLEDIPLEESAEIDAKLESIKNNYVESVARSRVRAVVESYQKKRSLEERSALCESIIENYRKQHAQDKADAHKAKMESAMTSKLAELGNKVAEKAEAKMESDMSKLDAKLESIVGKYSRTVAEKKAADKLSAKLESIVDRVSKEQGLSKKLDSILESASAPKVEPAKDPLDAKLESIIATAKQKIASATK